MTMTTYKASDREGYKQNCNDIIIQFRTPKIYSDWKIIQKSITFNWDSSDGNVSQPVVQLILHIFQKRNVNKDKEITSKWYHAKAEEKENLGWRREVGVGVHIQLEPLFEVIHSKWIHFHLCSTLLQASLTKDQRLHAREQAFLGSKHWLSR